MTAVMEKVAADRMEVALKAFDAAVNESDELEIDGVIWAGQKHEGKTCGEDTLKVLNQRRRVAYAVSVRDIVHQDPAAIIEALETGVRDKLYGITRIVGYYSRTSNWNKSKIGELKDRRRGDYSVKRVA